MSSQIRGLQAPLPKGYVFSADLPPAVQAIFRKLEPSVWGDGKAMEAAFTAVEYPHAEVGPRADMLTPAQRAVAAFITEHDLYTMDNDRDQWMPHGRRTRRRWLELDPPGALEEPITFLLAGKTMTEPVWRAVKLLKAAGGYQKAVAFVATLPLARRLQLWGERQDERGQAYGIGAKLFFDEADTKALKQLGAEGAAWAPAYADQRAAAAEADMDVRRVVFLALVRAGIPIEARWESLLPFGILHNEPFTIECVEAIPVERRTRAVLAALQAKPSWTSNAATLLMSRLPGPELAEAALSRLTASDREEAEKLRAAAKKNPAARAKIEAFLASLAPPAPTSPAIALSTTSVRKPGEEAALSALDREQLLVAGRRYHGKKVPLAKLVSDDPESEISLLHTLEYRALGDAEGRHVYDAWEYFGDAGTVFRAGTTEVVASVIQGSVDGCEDALAAALTVALRERVKKKAAPAAKKKAAPAAKKKAAPAAKKK